MSHSPVVCSPSKLGPQIRSWDKILTILTRSSRLRPRMSPLRSRKQHHAMLSESDFSLKEVDCYQAHTVEGYPRSVATPLLIVLPSVVTWPSDERLGHVVHPATAHVPTRLQLWIHRWLNSGLNELINYAKIKCKRKWTWSPRDSVT